MKKFLIVGLGNIGDEYANTRHNVGFKVVEALAESIGAKFSSYKLSQYAEMSYRGKIFIIVKPTTYMNLSGKAVKYWMDKEKIPLENILVVMDDISLDFGVLRLRKKGGDGGHNGLKNINLLLETQEYPRLRFGVGNDFYKGRQVDFVLGEWSKEQIELLSKDLLGKAVEVIISYAFEGIDIAMNKFNK